MAVTRRSLAAGALALAGAGAAFGSAGPALALNRDKLIGRAQEDLRELAHDTPRSRFFAHHAYAVLVFPSILKAGFVFGGETGDGVLFEQGSPTGFYNITGGSWGLQIGGQDFSYALFFMTPGSLKYLKHSDGFQVGTGPSIVVVNQGGGVEADSTTVTQDVYAFPFNEKGLMANLTLEGAKISRIH
jgi:lipid-binding SYLF domain-containing protein